MKTIALCAAVWLMTVGGLAAEEPLDLPAQIEALLHELDDDAFQVRQRAFRQLLRIGEPAVPYLRAALASSSPEVRQRSRQLIDEIRRVPLFTVTCDGWLVRLAVGESDIRLHTVAHLGGVFSEPRSRIQGLAMSPNQTLYAVGGWPSCLYRIRPEDGAIARVGTIGRAKINDLAFGPDGKLYGANIACAHANVSALEWLVVIDVETAEATSVSACVGEPRPRALAINARQHMCFPCSRHRIFRLEPDRQPLLEWPLQYVRDTGLLSTRDLIHGLAYGADGSLFAVFNRRDSFLLRIEPHDGTIRIYKHFGLETENLAGVR